MNELAASDIVQERLGAVRKRGIIKRGKNMTINAYFSGKQVSVQVENVKPSA